MISGARRLPWFINAYTKIRIQIYWFILNRRKTMKSNSRLNTRSQLKVRLSVVPLMDSLLA